MAFHVGQKVVCVDTSSPTIRGGRYALNFLKEGGVYVVTNTRMDPFEGTAAVQVSGVPLESPQGRIIWLQAARFRPLTEKKTDISCFTAILDRVNSKKRHPKKVEA